MCFTSQITCLHTAARIVRENAYFCTRQECFVFVAESMHNEHKVTTVKLFVFRGSDRSLQHTCKSWHPPPRAGIIPLESMNISGRCWMRPCTHRNTSQMTNAHREASQRAPNSGITVWASPGAQAPHLRQQILFHQSVAALSPSSRRDRFQAAGLST